jgi:DNA-binding GntR family transcriptional regulator
MILGIIDSRELDHREHLALLEAMERRDAALAGERMRQHIEGVVEAVRRWDPEHYPVD